MAVNIQKLQYLIKNNSSKHFLNVVNKCFELL